MVTHEELLPKGYKQTEIGVVPADWTVEPLGRYATFRTGPFGSALHKSDYINDGIPIVNPMHIVDGRIEPTRTMTITERAAKLLSEFCMKAGEIVIGRRGDMGRCAVVRNDQAGFLCGTGSMIIRPHNADAFFLQRILSSPRAISAIEETSVGTTMINLNQSILAALKIQFPPLPEQEAIAEALSDADALIESLEQLIAKKRQIKQGAMQELLTGKRRLPGFALAHQNFKQTEVGMIPEDWNLDFIENFANITTGNKNTQDRIEDGKYPFFVRSQKIEHINSYSYEGEAVLTAGDGVGTGKVFHYINGKFDVHQRVYRISQFKESVNGYFFYLYFSNNFFGRIMQMTAKSSVDSVRRNMISKMPIPLPPTVAEQTAIATILSDMDAEITALETKLTKAWHIKQGMMQELLTGRIRLV